MSMSSSVVGIRKPDARHEQMLSIYRTCTEAGVEPPAEVLTYFEDCSGDPRTDDTAGLSVPIKSRPYRAEMVDGIDVDVASLPDNVVTIRFKNMY